MATESTYESKGNKSNILFLLRYDTDIGRFKFLNIAQHPENPLCQKIYCISIYFYRLCFSRVSNCNIFDNLNENCF